MQSAASKKLANTLFPKLLSLKLENYLTPIVKQTNPH